MYTIEKLHKYAQDYYGAHIEYPWSSNPTSSVIRHEHSRKWFALAMKLSEYTLGLSDDKDSILEVVNLKLNPLDVEFLKSQPGFAPAYHMNKTHWITVILDGSISDEQIEDMLKTSYTLTHA